MNDRTKSRIALALAASLISLALAVSASTLILTERASRTSPDPLGTYEEAVQDDGFESIDWDYWLSGFEMGGRVPPIVFVLGGL